MIYKYQGVAKIKNYNKQEQEDIKLVWEDQDSGLDFIKKFTLVSLDRGET